MTSTTRVPPRRIQTQTHLTAPSKPTISVEEWEAKAPLLDAAMKSINAIKAASEHRPLPPKVNLGIGHARMDSLRLIQSFPQMMFCLPGHRLLLFGGLVVHHRVQGLQTSRRPQRIEGTPLCTLCTQSNPSKPLNNSTIGSR